MRRDPHSHSLARVIVSIFFVATFLYNEDVSKHATDLPLTGGSGTAHTRSPDLRVLQEGTHHKVNSRQARSTHHAEEEEVGSKSKWKEEEEQAAKAQQVVQILDALISLDGGGSGSNNMNNNTMVKTEKERMRWPTAVRLAESGLDVYKGWWVYDAEGAQVPLHREGECEFLTEQATCMSNTRRNDSYQKWWWQPAGCSGGPRISRMGIRG